ncbi:MAG: redoxin domain-containing protein [Acidobacteriota bacterium]
MAYFAASVDTPEDNTRFAAQVGADYPILADPTKETARAYGVLGRAGVANRWIFYIGVDGTILHVETSVPTASVGGDVAGQLSALGVAKR